MPNATGSGSVEKTVKKLEKQRRRSPYAFLPLDRNVFAFLNRLHMASGMGVAWILLADTIAGSFIILSLTGILLWTRLHGPRLLAAALGLGSLTLAIFFIWRAF